MTIAELREAVLLRDRECIAFIVDRSHICRDRWGKEHAPDDLASLTLGHVRKDPGGARRDEPGWCVAQCWAANDRHWESANAAIVRTYLEGIRRQAEYLSKHPDPPLTGTAQPAITIPPGAMRRIELEEAMR